MTVESAADRANFFADFGTAAPYRAGGAGDGSAVTVIFDRPSRRDPFLSAGMSGPGFVAMVRASEVAAPALRDTLTIGGTARTEIEIMGESTATLVVGPSLNKAATIHQFTAPDNHLTAQSSNFWNSATGIGRPNR